MADAVVVVGASGGLGRAFVDRFVGDGLHSAVWALSRGGEAMSGARGLKADVTDQASLAEAARRIADGPAPARIVVATGVLHAPFQPERGFRQMEPEHLMRDFQVNAVGPAMAAKHLAPLMPRDRPAVFAVLSARVGSIGDNRLGGWHAYRASKAALNMILRNLAIELGRTHPNAVVTGLHPGTVNTPLSLPFQKGLAPDRLFAPAYAVDRLVEVMDRLTPADSGGVFDWAGQRLPD
ncbi:SDR family NAD(P)-dependent oxidoreductase [Brevundimonas sp. PAMC22021]|uniref:SDR family NAD(P)-dependent oxidoreductase n=1 Tax=Brevundimonas sp. PAMC22021 TaxID=2861285 RepID=UPI001C627B1D|nr:SDR family NAD(P)-dependent oxidoreductase [Brevundimonas sp. PAMC22021]QYF87235.1 SDR family NAD(P)-dependent oxidoreductase [Brevundimonas sp. PAMC22021]